MEKVKKGGRDWKGEGWRDWRTKGWRGWREWRRR
jgi:hypothetical protein